MNNVIKFGYIFFPHSNEVLLIKVLGKLIYKFIFCSNWKAVKCPWRSDGKFHFLKQSVTENPSTNELLQFHASLNYDYDAETFSTIVDNHFSMKNPWHLLNSYVFNFLNSETAVRGLSIEHEVFVMKSNVIKIDKTFRTVSRSIDIIFTILIGKFLKLLYSPEIIDLIIEKNCLGKIRLAVEGSSSELFEENIYEKCSQNAHESSDITESITSFTVISSGIITINGNKLERSHTPQTNTEIQEWQLSKMDCQADGDIHRIEVSNNIEEDKFTSISRISKARNWINNNRNPPEPAHGNPNNKISNEKKTFKIKKSNKKSKSTQLKQKKPIDKSKLPRFIVKKSDLVKNSTNNSSTNLSNRKKPAKTRFTVLKSKSNSQESPPDIVKKKTCSRKLMGKSRKPPKLVNTTILSSIRQEVLNLANELHQNYIRHSQSIVSPSKSPSLNDKIKPLKKDLLLEEVRKRLQRQPRFKKRDPLSSDEEVLEFFNNKSLDTLNGLKSINSKRQDSFSHKYDTLSMLSTSNNPFNSGFMTVSENTSYRSIVSSRNNSPCLDSYDLRDIHLISDEIHGLAQKELMKTS